MSVCAQSFLEYFLKVPYYGGTEQGGGGGHGWCYAGGVCTMILQQSLLLCITHNQIPIFFSY